MNDLQIQALQILAERMLAEAHPTASNPAGNPLLHMAATTLAGVLSNDPKEVPSTWTPSQLEPEAFDEALKNQPALAAMHANYDKR